MSKYVTTVVLNARFNEYNTYLPTKVWFEKLEDGENVKVWCEDFKTGTRFLKLPPKTITREELANSPDDDILFFEYAIGLFGGESITTNFATNVSAQENSAKPEIIKLTSETLFTKDLDSVTIINIAGHSFKALDLEISTFGLTQSSVITVDTVLMHETDDSNEFVIGYIAEDYSFERDTIEGFELNPSVRVAGVSDNGVLLLKDDADYAIVRIG